jgi:hypothetical protein
MAKHNLPPVHPPANPAATDVDDALAMLSMGLPLSTRVRHCEFSPKYAKIFLDMLKARNKFLNVAADYLN